MAHRVIQWATGNVGRIALRQILDHPELELVGCLVHSEAKAGVDAAEFCRRPACGVAATTDVDEILALDADCVAHMPLPSAQHGDDPGADLRNLCRLLESGKNVVTTVGYVYPKAYGADVEAQIEAACRAGGSSLHGTGANPGFMNEVLPLTLSGLSARIDRIYVRESTNFAWYPSPEIICDMMGLGCSEADYPATSKRFSTWLDGLFRESLLLLAHGLGAEVEDVLFEADHQLAKQEYEIAAGRIAAGSVGAQRYRWTAIIGGEPRVELEAVYKAHRDIAADWPDAGFVCRVEGKPRMELDLPESWMNNGLAATAVHAVHAIPSVCRAEPGIRTFLDLPMVLGRHSFATGPIPQDKRPG